MGRGRRYDVARFGEDDARSIDDIPIEHVVINQVVVLAVGVDLPPVEFAYKRTVDLFGLLWTRRKSDLSAHVRIIHVCFSCQRWLNAFDRRCPVSR